MHFSFLKHWNSRPAKYQKINTWRETPTKCCIPNSPLTPGLCVGCNALPGMFFPVSARLSHTPDIGSLAPTYFLGLWLDDVVFGESNLAPVVVHLPYYDTVIVWCRHCRPHWSFIPWEPGLRFVHHCTLRSWLCMHSFGQSLFTDGLPSVRQCLGHWKSKHLSGR